jgi:hypothetical protein
MSTLFREKLFDYITDKKIKRVNQRTLPTSAFFRIVHANNLPDSPELFDNNSEDFTVDKSFFNALGVMIVSRVIHHGSLLGCFQLHPPQLIYI